MKYYWSIVYWSKNYEVDEYHGSVWPVHYLNIANKGKY